MDKLVVCSKTDSSFIPSRKGNLVLVDPFQFTYNKEKLSKDGLRAYWACTRKRSTVDPNCPGKAVTTASGDKILLTKEHNHPADPVKVEVKKKEARIIELTKANPRQTTDLLVWIWIKETIHPSERAKTCKKASFERRIQKVKASFNQRPPSPKTFADLEFIPEKFQKTFDGDQFLLANFTAENNSDRTVIYSSAFGLKLLRTSKSWSGDGTFYVTPEPFFQLYSLLAELDGHSYPAAFFFLPNKKSPTYRAAFAQLRQALEAGSQSPVAPDQFVVDFEMPVMKEFKSEFKCKRIVGCFVHLKRNLWRKLGAVRHLQGFYCKHKEFYIFINSLIALAFVPIGALQDYYKDLLKQDLPSVQNLIDEEGDDPLMMRESLDQFLTFFEMYYLGSETRTGWSQPRFSPEIWSQYLTVLNGEQMTTNRNENFHLCLKKSIQMISSFWTVVDTLSDVEAKARVNRDEHRSFDDKENKSPESGTSREKRRSFRAEELKHIIQHRTEYERVEYLNRIAGMIKLD